jgi:hypothetical protein
MYNTARRNLKVLGNEGVFSFVSDNSMWDCVTMYHLLHQLNPKHSFKETKRGISLRISRVYGFSESTIYKVVSKTVTCGFLKENNNGYILVSFKEFASILGVDISSEDTPCIIYKFSKSLLAFSKKHCDGKFLPLKDEIRDHYYAVAVNNNQKQQKYRVIEKYKSRAKKEILGNNSEKLDKGDARSLEDVNIGDKNFNDYNPFLTAGQNKKKLAKILSDITSEKWIKKVYSSVSMIGNHYNFDFSLSSLRLSELAGMSRTATVNMIKKNSLLNYSNRKVEIKGNKSYLSEYLRVSGYNSNFRDYSLSFDNNTGIITRTLTNSISVSPNFFKNLKSCFVKSIC